MSGEAGYLREISAIYLFFEAETSLGWNSDRSREAKAMAQSNLKSETST